MALIRAFIALEPEWLRKIIALAPGRRDRCASMSGGGVQLISRDYGRIT